MLLNVYGAKQLCKVIAQPRCAKNEINKQLFSIIVQNKGGRGPKLLHKWWGRWRGGGKEEEEEGPSTDS